MFHKIVNDNNLALFLPSEMPFCAVPYKVFIQDSFCSYNDENAYVMSLKTECTPVFCAGIAWYYIQPILFSINGAVPVLWQ
jgi:hypothetical protein